MPRDHQPLRTLILLAAGLVPASAAAQAPAVAAVSVALDSVALRARLRVETHVGDRFYGRLLRRDPFVFYLSAPGPDDERSVHLRTVAALWRQRGTHASQYGTIGAAVGAVAVGALAIGLNGLDDSADACRGVCALPTGALSGAIVGTLIGGAIGALNPRWERLTP